MAGTPTISGQRPFPRRPIPSAEADWVEGGIAASSALRSRASPTTGTRLQQLDQVAPGRCVTVCLRGWLAPASQDLWWLVCEGLATPIQERRRHDDTGSGRCLGISFCSVPLLGY